MIGAYARAAQVLGHEEYLHAAQRAAAFIKTNMFDAGKNELLRSYREGPSTIAGFAADYVFLISGLIDLYHADFDIEWLRWARRLQDTLDLHFWDQDRGGYYSTSDHDPAILLRMKEDYDGAEPTPNSVAALNLWRFGLLFHNTVLIEHARHTVRALESRLEAQPIAMPLLLVGAALLKTPPHHLVIHTPTRDHPALAPLLAEARRHYLPQMVVILISTEAEREFFSPAASPSATSPRRSPNPPPTSARNTSASAPSPSPKTSAPSSINWLKTRSVPILGGTRSCPSVRPPITYRVRSPRNATTPRASPDGQEPVPPTIPIARERFQGILDPNGDLCEIKKAPSS